MGDPHRHLEITEEEWGAFMDDVQQTLNKFDVPPPEQEELKAIIEPTHEAIVVWRLQSATLLREAGRGLPTAWRSRAKGAAR